jgi:hypothetical protein
MITRPAKTTLRKPPRRDEGTSDHDPAQLSASLRELSLRAFKLVRARDGSASKFERGGDCLEKELKDVHGQIVQLQRALRAHYMDDLAAYVTALRERVEESLA